EPLLKLGANGIFQPKQVIGLQTLAEASGFNRRQPEVDIVEQMNLIADAVSGGKSGNSRLRTNGAISHADVLSNFIAGFLNITSVSVTVDQSAGSALAAEQVVHRRTESLTFDIPERDIHSGNGGHGHGATTPIGATVQILPNILGLKGIASNNAGNHVILQIRSNR